MVFEFDCRIDKRVVSGIRIFNELKLLLQHFRHSRRNAAYEDDLSRFPY